ncbi:MAG: HAD family hydrolase, partial [Candidatus Diapherotrites archaeon]
IRCVIFGVGDTLYNSELLRQLNDREKLELEELRKAGYHFSAKAYLVASEKVYKNWDKLKFKNRKQFISYYVQHYLGIKKPSWALARKIYKAFSSLCPRFTPEQMFSPNARKIIKWLAKNGYYLGIVSDAHTKDGKKWLGKVKLDKHFHHISISHEIGYEKNTSKPFQLFLKKMQQKNKINLEPQECLVVDDSQGACRNAQSIGMRVALYDPFKRKKLNFFPEYRIHNLLQIKKILEKG